MIPLTFAGLSATAQDVAFSDHFDDDAFGWVSLDAAVVIDWVLEEDREDSPTSGAAHIVNSRSTPDNRPIEYVLPLGCFPIDSDLDYEIGGSIKIPTGAGQDAAVAQMSAAWYLTGSCGSPVGFGHSWDVRTPGDDWTDVADLLDPPPLAASARLGMTVFNLAGAGSVEVYFDDVFFVPEPSAGLLNALALAALMAVRRSAVARSRGSARPRPSCPAAT